MRGREPSDFDTRVRRVDSDCRECHEGNVVETVKILVKRFAFV